MKYDYNTLLEFCKENNIILCDDYSNVTLNRETQIKEFVKLKIVITYLLKGFELYYNQMGFALLAQLIIVKIKQKKQIWKNMGLNLQHNLKK